MKRPPRGARSRRRPLGEVEREILFWLRALRVALGREPSDGEIAERLGLAPSQVRARLSMLAGLGLKPPPPAPVVDRRRGQR